jgi:hypothetical protein
MAVAVAAAAALVGRGGQLCVRARENECPLWFTSKDQDTPLHTDLPLSTAVVLPIRLDGSHKVGLRVRHRTLTVEVFRWSSSERRCMPDGAC